MQWILFLTIITSGYGAVGTHTVKFNNRMSCDEAGIELQTTLKGLDRHSRVSYTCKPEGRLPK